MINGSGLAVILLSSISNREGSVPVELWAQKAGDQNTTYMTGVWNVATGELKLDHEESSSLDLSEFDSVTYYLRHDDDSLAALNEAGPMEKSY